jgi:hypothetical protein
VFIKIDMLGGEGNGAKGGFGHGRWLTNKGNHSAIMIWVWADVENSCAPNRSNLFSDAVVDVRITAVTKVGDTFNDLRHGGKFSFFLISIQKTGHFYHEQGQLTNLI